MSNYGMNEMAFAIALAEGRYTNPLCVSRHCAQVYSQNGEDGIIAEIFRRIGACSRIFVEIGIETGQENNTRLLLEQGWRGVWIEASSENAARARSGFHNFLSSGQLKIVEAIAEPRNIEHLLDDSNVPEEFDFLSLDVDYGTSHLWRALRRRSRVACIEYNAALPPSIALEVPHDSTGAWDGTNWFGASLKALEQIGENKRLHLVGCDLLGVNAFFVSQDETKGRFRAPFTAEAHWEPLRLESARHLGHPASPEARRWVSI